MLGIWEKIANFINWKHPEKIAIGCVAALFNDTVLKHFRNILKERKKQTSLDRFLMKCPAKIDNKS